MIHYHVNKLKNNKKVYDYDDNTDNLHTIIIKNRLQSLIHPINHSIIGRIQLEYSNINIRRIPYKKTNKSPQFIKGYRPLAVEKILWKLYQMISAKIQKYSSGT